MLCVVFFFFFFFFFQAEDGIRDLTVTGVQTCALPILPARVTDAISHTPVFPESYVLGMADVIAGGTRNSWVFGRVYPTGKWFYFPIAFLVKSSIALLLLVPLALVYLGFNHQKWREGMFLL